MNRDGLPAHAGKRAPREAVPQNLGAIATAHPDMMRVHCSPNAARARPPRVGSWKVRTSFAIAGPEVIAAASAWRAANLILRLCAL
jgi:hypothetical protein